MRRGWPPVPRRTARAPAAAALSSSGTGGRFCRTPAAPAPQGRPARSGDRGLVRRRRGRSSCSASRISVVEQPELFGQFRELPTQPADVEERLQRQDQRCDRTHDRRPETHIVPIHATPSGPSTARRGATQRIGLREGRGDHIMSEHSLTSGIFIVRSMHEGVKAKVEQAAIELFAAKGVDGVSIGEIAAAAGVSQGALYRHYPSKEDLAWTLFATAYLRTGAELAEISRPAAAASGRGSARWSRISAPSTTRPGPLPLHADRAARFPAARSHGASAPRSMRSPKTVADAVRAGEIAAVDPLAGGAAILGVILQTAVFHIYGRLEGALSAAGAEPGACRDRGGRGAGAGADRFATLLCRWNLERGSAVARGRPTMLPTARISRGPAAPGARCCAEIPQRQRVVATVLPPAR